MAQYKYIAYNKSGVRQESTLEASSEQEARKQLEADGLLLVSIESNDNQGLSFGAMGANRLTIKDVEFFTAEMALLLQSGLKVDKGIGILRTNVEKPALHQLLESVLQDIKQGLPLSAALEKFKAFDSLYIGLLKIAEETGELAPTFERLAVELKYQLELSNKVKQALIYPGVILTVCIFALLFIFNFVVPNLATLFSARDDLPLYTVALLNVSEFMQNYQFHLFALVIGGGLLLYNQRDKEYVQQLQQFMRERMPGVAGANLLVERVRFNAALATMLASGVAIDRALKLALDTLRSRSLRHEVQVAIENVRRGDGLSRSLSETRIYPPYFASLLNIGEESGQLERVFNEIAERSRTAFYNWVTRFTTLLEPILILTMGVIVGTVVVIMMLSISAITNVDF